MPYAIKIDRIKLNEYISEGKTQADFARDYNVSPAAVSKAVRRFNLALAQNVSTRQAGQLVDTKKTAMDRLMDLVDKCEKELAWVEEKHPPSEDKDYKDWRDQKIKHMAEARKLITAMADIRTKIYDSERPEKAYIIMLEIISEASDELKKKIRDRFQRSAIHFEWND